MNSTINPNQTCSIITNIQISQLSRVYHTTRLTQRVTEHSIALLYRGHLAYTYDGRSTYFWPKSMETNSIEKIQGKTSNNLRIQGI